MFKLILISVLIFTFCTSQHKNTTTVKHPINKIIFSSISGYKSGDKLSLSITQKNITYNKSSNFPKNNQTKTIKTSPFLWKKSFSFQNFNATKSTERHVAYDGTDTTISIYKRQPFFKNQ